MAKNWSWTHCVGEISAHRPTCDVSDISGERWKINSCSHQRTSKPLVRHNVFPTSSNSIMWLENPLGQSYLIIFFYSWIESVVWPTYRTLYRSHATFPAGQHNHCSPVVHMELLQNTYTSVAVAITTLQTETKLNDYPWSNWCLSMCLQITNHLL